MCLHLLSMKFLKTDELNRPSKSEYADILKIPVIVVLDNVRSALNVGSVFRTSDSFMISKIILCGITAKPPEKEILKTALGATESVVWEYHVTTSNALIQLKDEGHLLYAIEQSDNSIPLNKFPVQLDAKYVLIFGNEVKGVDPTLIPMLDGAIEIPQSGIKHSLNVSVCAGVVLWHFYENMKLK